MKNISRKGKGFFAPTVAAALALATAFTLSCSSNAGLPPPPEDAEGNVFCYIGGIGGTCVEVSAGMCQAASGTKVSSCGTAAGNSSSSASQSESVSCKVGSACELLPKPTCSVLQGTEVTSCGGSNSGTGGGSSSSGTGRSSSSIGNTDNTPPVAGTGGPVAVYGRLKACTISGKGQVCGSGSYASQAVQVKGVSLFWSNTGWGGEKFFTASTINTLVDDWKAEIIRVPIGYAESGGYKTDASNLTRVKTAVNAAIARGVYVIIDWHSHDANNELTAATAFFKEMAGLYGSYDNVIFEVFNEPKEISWSTIKSYATSIVSTIRTNGGANSLVLVGTPKYSVNPKAAIGDFLSDNNVAYVFHFYAAEHPTIGTNWADNTTTYSSNVTAVLNAGKPIFASEYGTVMVNGDSPHSATNSDAWHTFMNSNKISSCAWSVNDKAEGASFFNSSGGRTTSGTYIYNMLRTWANSAPWRSGNGGGTWGGYYCDYGPYHSASNTDRNKIGGGCSPVDSRSDCDEEWGKYATSCGRTDLQFCDYGQWHQYIDDYGYSQWGGGCWGINNTSDHNNCYNDYLYGYANIVSKCSWLN